MNRPTTRASRLAPPDPRLEQGLTMVELLVSLLLAAILTAGLFYMMSGQSQGYRNQLTNMSTQENLWGAMEFLQRNIRMAGFGMGHCPGGMVLQFDTVGGGPPTWLPPNTRPWMRAIRVYNGCDLFTDTNVPPCPTSDIDSPDSFSVAFSERPEGMIAVRVVDPIPTSATTSPIIVRSRGPFDTGDLIALWRPGAPGHCTLLELDAVPQTAGLDRWKLPRPSGGSINPPDGTNIFPPGGYDQRAVVIRLQPGNAAEPPIVVLRHFAVVIDNSRPEVIPQLVTWVGSDKAGREVVADGVEDLQISYACDDTTPGSPPLPPPDGAFTEGTDDLKRKDDEWAHNVATETDTDGNGLPDPMQCAGGVGAVRITLIARSPSEADVAPENTRPGAEDRPTSGTPDAYTRRQLTTMVYPRNMRQQQ